MSELHPLPFAAMGSEGFRVDARFAGEQAAPVSASPEAEPVDPLALAWSDGFAAGAREAEARAEAALTVERAARDALELSIARLDASLQEELRLRLRETVAALCESALEPMALDKQALARRVDKAVALLARADDERVIRLHPEDIALLGPGLLGEWTVKPDPALERGALRVESATGGVEDGPEQWRRAIAEALYQC